jgi:hypothetical protein
MVEFDARFASWKGGLIVQRHLGFRHADAGEPGNGKRRCD